MESGREGELLQANRVADEGRKKMYGEAERKGVIKGWVQFAWISKEG